MRRRDILAGGGLLASGAAQTFPAPAIAQGIRQLKMVTDWPDGTPGLHTSAVRLAKTIGVATGGRIQVEVFPAGALVRAFETFDAVAAGVADIYHSFEGYFEQKARALTFFSAIPFGFTADELFAWVHYGSGQELWDALSGRSTSRRFSALAPDVRWVGGSFKKSTRLRTTRACGTAWVDQAQRCSGAWAPLW